MLSPDFIRARLCMVGLIYFWFLPDFRMSPNSTRYSLLQLCHAASKPFFRHRTMERNSAFTRLFSSSWHGGTKPFSEYATHVRVGEKDAPTTVANAIFNSMQTAHGPDVVVESSSGDDDSSLNIPRQSQQLNPRQLLQLGAIWYLSAEDYQHNQNQIPNSIVKPSRLVLENATVELQVGDYLRIHHTPRRFMQVYNSSWNAFGVTSPSSVIVQSGSSGFWIINKPPLVPVHGTVDNVIENVVNQLKQANTDSVDYVATTQRLDINTSGLLVVAKSKEFAAYFAQLLRHKTKQDKKQNQSNNNTIVEKGYKCLVCLQQNDDERDSSVFSAWKRLKDLQNTTIRHYLEPSDRAPKRFELEPPSQQENWLKCLLKITKVRSIHPITSSSSPLANSLWKAGQMPSNCKAICEVDIALMTGRTHQIRGQLAQLGYPLVGDEQYGGAVPTTCRKIDPNPPQLLALQCSKVGFFDADYSTVWNKRKHRDVIRGFPSDRWISASLERAWWTLLLEEAEASSSGITSSQDFEILEKQQQQQQRELSSLTDERRPDLLPPSIQLSPGRNKYVLVELKEADNDNGRVRWFVKSGSPKECGGPYHADVAQGLLEWIEAAGYPNKKVVVTGGGRIDYDPEKATAHVYGFSYGYGKGKHAKVAELINLQQCSSTSSAQENRITATYDNSDSLY